MSHYLVVVECAVEWEGKYLVIRRPDGVHAGGLLAFPGGKVDYEDGQDQQNILKNAVKREVQEEVGLDLIDPIRFVTSSFFIADDGQHVLDVIFHCKLDKTINQVVPLKREVPEYFWLSADEISKHPNSPEWLKRYITQVEKVDQEL